MSNRERLALALILTAYALACALLWMAMPESGQVVTINVSEER